VANPSRYRPMGASLPVTPCNTEDALSLWGGCVQSGEKDAKLLGKINAAELINMGPDQDAANGCAHHFTHSSDEWGLQGDVAERCDTEVSKVALQEQDPDLDASVRSAIIYSRPADPWEQFGRDVQRSDTEVSKSASQGQVQWTPVVLELTEYPAHDEEGGVRETFQDEACQRKQDSESSNNDLPWYGLPLAPTEAAAILPPGAGGLIWHAVLAGESWTDVDHCSADGAIKARRHILPVRAHDFFSSLVQTNDGRWLFTGILNGWPGLSCIELLLIQHRDLRRRSRIVDSWSAEDPKREEPCFPPKVLAAGATLRMAPWSAFGWSRESPGFVWWFFAQRSSQERRPRFAFGQKIVETLQDDMRAGQEMGNAVHAHLFAHRYALGNKRIESRQDRKTYHAAVLVEWSHGHYATVIELGPLNGIAGRFGRSDWYHDKLQERTALGSVMPKCMIMPWKTDLAEIRCSDVEARNLTEFQHYVSAYTGPSGRFIDPHFQHSAPVRLCNRSQLDIARYLLNYLAHDQRFDIRTRSCQTFAADFFSLLSGEDGTQPFHPNLRRGYVPHKDWFLYVPPQRESCCQ